MTLMVFWSKTDERELNCSFKIEESNWYGNLSACIIEHDIDHEGYVLGSPLNSTVQRFKISDNEEVKFLPAQIGQKFPNLTDFWTEKCGLTIVRDFYFKNMGNLRLLGLNNNKILSVEPEAFRDLVNVEDLQLFGNKIVTLDEKLFVTMVELDYVTLTHNQIKFLSSTTFRIPGGKLKTVNLEENVCIDSLYSFNGWFMNNTLEKLESDILSDCKRIEQWIMMNFLRLWSDIFLFQGFDLLSFYFNQKNCRNWFFLS